MSRPVLVVALLLVAGFGIMAWAPSLRRVLLPEAGTNPERTARWLRKLVAARFEDKGLPLPPSRVKTHYVVLVNTSQLPETAYPEFVRYLVGRFVSDLRLECDAQDVRSDDRPLVSLYPYQNDLYFDPEHARERLRLEPGFESVLLEPISPDHKTAINRNLDGSPYRGGHRNEPSRNALLARLGDPNDARATVVVQVTPITSDDYAVGKTTGLPLPRGWEEYLPSKGDLGPPSFTRPPSGTRDPVKVNMRIFGPRELTRLRLAQVASPKTVLAAEDVPSWERAMPLIGGSAVLTALAVLAAMWLRRSYWIEVPGTQERHIARFGRLEVFGHGARVLGENVIVLPRGDSGNVPGVRVGEVCFGLFSLEPFARGVDGYNALNSVGRAGPVSLRDGPTMNVVRFKLNELETERISIDVREGIK